MAAKPPTQVDLVWERELVFNGTSGSARVTLDSAGVAGPSPVQALAFALAGCMAMDVVHIIRKGRHPFTAVSTTLSGTRADSDPRRFTSIALHFTITGTVPDEVVARAIELSREKYCTVWHSMRQDIELRATFTVQPEG